MGRSPDRTGNAVFLDRDGTLVEDVGALTEYHQIEIRAGVVEATRMLSDRGWALIVVTNQTVVSRGLASETRVRSINAEISRQILEQGGGPIAGWYICPHHPNANLVEYKIECECRKPRSGLLKQAAADLGIDLQHSYMMGDRVSDIAAGNLATCRTILIRSGHHEDGPTEFWGDVDTSIEPDLVCDDLLEAAIAIVEGGR